MNLKEIQETPDYLLKNITVNEISEKELFNDLNNSGIPADKTEAFKLKAEQELKTITGNDKQFISDGKLPEKFTFGQGENKVNLGSLLDAELCTKLIDTMIPSFYVLLLRVGAGIKVNKKDLQASPRELDMMHPIVQKCLEAIEFNINNPFVALGLVVGVIYTTKAADAGVDNFLNKDGNTPYNTTGEKKQRKPRSDAGQKRK